jgi:hypothetical protein
MTESTDIGERAHADKAMSNPHTAEQTILLFIIT